MAASTAVQGHFSTGTRQASSVWDLVLAITIRDLRVKYHGTYLSYFWWIAKPLAMGLILYFALSYVLNVDIPHHAIFLLSALFPWFWFQGALQAATGSFVGNAGLIKKVQFPRVILPVSVVLAATFEFAVTLPVLVILVLANGLDPSWTWLIGIPILLAVQLALLVGLGVGLACVNVFLRDLAPAVDSVLAMLFYASPIIYPLSRVPSSIRPILNLNPLVPILDAWRAMFIDGELPGIELWPAVLFAAGSLAAAALILRKLGGNIADAL